MNERTNPLSGRHLVRESPPLGLVVVEVRRDFYRTTRARRSFKLACVVLFHVAADVDFEWLTLPVHVSRTSARPTSRTSKVIAIDSIKHKPPPKGYHKLISSAGGTFRWTSFRANLCHRDSRAASSKLANSRLQSLGRVTLA